MRADPPCQAPSPVVLGPAGCPVPLHAFCGVPPAHASMCCSRNRRSIALRASASVARKSSRAVSPPRHTMRITCGPQEGLARAP